MYIYVHIYIYIYICIYELEEDVAGVYTLALRCWRPGIGGILHYYDYR